MNFEEWWNETEQYDNHGDPVKATWEAGIKEGIERMYRLYDICPQCKLPNGQHKMDCTRV